MWVVGGELIAGGWRGGLGDGWVDDGDGFAFVSASMGREESV